VILRGAPRTQRRYGDSASCGHRKKPRTSRSSPAVLAIRHPRQKSGNSSAAGHLLAAGGAQLLFGVPSAKEFGMGAVIGGPMGRVSASHAPRMADAPRRHRQSSAGAEAQRKPSLSAGAAQLICLTPRGPLINCSSVKRAEITVGCAFSGSSLPPAAASSRPLLPPPRSQSRASEEPIIMGVEAKSSLKFSSAAGARWSAFARIRPAQSSGTSDGYSAHFGRVQLRSKMEPAAQNGRAGDCGMPFAVVLSRNALHLWVGAANQEAA